MSVNHGRFGVRHSALGWLRRLGWNYLEARELGPLRGLPESTLLENRLLPWLRRFRFERHGELLPLSPEGIHEIISAVDTCCHSLDWEASSATVHRLLVEGARTVQQLPDGSRTEVLVPLIDWEHVQRNHWDMADAEPYPDPLDPDIRELVGYVNGIPLVVLACVERDREKRWGTVAAGISHLWRGKTAFVSHRPALHAQLLLCLDRRGGCYASVGTAAHGWMRWREHGWSRERVDQLRERPVPFAEVTLDPPWAAHAELLQGVLGPARFLQLLRGFLHTGAHGRRYVARPGQFFAVQHALQALRSRDFEGRRGGGQLCLAAGSGLQRARYWLLHALRADPEFEGLRILLPVARPTPAPQDHKRRTGPQAADQLTEFLAGHASSPHEVPLRVFRGWGRKAAPPTPAAEAGTEILLLVDANFWESPPALLRRLRRCLPRSTWLTLSSQPILLPAADLDPGAPLYHYPPEHAVADGVVVPAWRDGGAIYPVLSRDMPADAQATPGELRQAQVATAISQHFHGVVRVAERNLRGTLLVETPKEAEDYQRALHADGRLQTQLTGYDSRGLPTQRASEGIPPQVELVIAHGDLPASQDARLGLLYVDRPLSDPERLRAVGLINAPHPDKRAALVVDFHASGMNESPGQEWMPGSVQVNRDALAGDDRRLQGLLPERAEENFHACRDHLAPDWTLGAHGDDIDLNRRRRDLLHRRVTEFGQRLQVAIASEAAFTGEQAAVSARYRSTLHRYSVLRDAVSQLALEEDRFNPEDLRVRHWARERAPAVHEEPLDYQVVAPVEQSDPAGRQQSNEMYTRLRHQLGQTGEEPHLIEQARYNLSQILLSPAGQMRLDALLAFEATQQVSLHGGSGVRTPSRGLAVLEGLFGPTRHQADRISMGALIDVVVAEAHAGPRILFHEHLRDRLEPLLRRHLKEVQVQAVLHAVLSRAHDWPPG
ncbi:type I restriction endonuclease [Stenotrophomonas sp.]|uniref:type I restriction endonuclease n=1 Tax=Stenotrophomonas sp. TaxID=69392 RepID=UPI0028A0482C|nr:type I restriction endonuclease [Stenotrophomonas sp.]